MVQIQRDKITKNTIRLAIKKAKELNIEKIVIASCTGKTAELLIGSGLEIICVTHQVGFCKPNNDEMSAKMRKKLASSGVKLLTTTHLLGGVDRTLRMQFKGVYPSEIVSTAFRVFGQGVKACIYISVMAADTGLIKAGKDIIVVGETDRGADTAPAINPSRSQDFFKTKVREIICKPCD